MFLHRKFTSNTVEFLIMFEYSFDLLALKQIFELGDTNTGIKFLHQALLHSDCCL